jgi:hypothetical protein
MMQATDTAATSSLNREARAGEWIRLLTSIPARFAGTASERTAAERVAEWAQQLGAREVSLAPVPAPPKAGAVLALHLGLAAIGLYIGGFVGVLLTVLAAVSFHCEYRRHARVASRLLAGSQSVNVITRMGTDKPARRVILTAHIDTTQAGWLFSPALADLFALFSGGARKDGEPPPGPIVVPEVTVHLAAVLAMTAWMGAHGVLFWLINAATLGLLLFGTVTTFQWATAPPTPGANDNASAVAAMLTCAERLLPDLPADVEIWCVGTGAEEVGCVGVRRLLDTHPEWEIDSTYFVNFECVGGGALHWVRTEGLLTKGGYPPMLIELARRLAAGGHYGEITPTDLMAATDGHVPADRGFPTLSLISLQPNGVPLNYHRLEDTADAIDCSVVVRSADFGAAVAAAALAGKAGAIVA